jgi:cytochrome P450
MENQQVQPSPFFLPEIASMLGLLFNPYRYARFVARRTSGAPVRLWKKDTYTGGPVFIFFQPEDIFKIFSDRDGERSPLVRLEMVPLLGHSLGTTEGEEAVHQREMMSRVIGYGSVKNRIHEMKPGVEWLGDQFSRAAKTGNVIENAVPLVAKALLKIFFTIIFGVEDAERYGNLSSAYQRVLTTVYRRLLRPPFLSGRMAKVLYGKEDRRFAEDIAYIRSEVGATLVHASATPLAGSIFDRLKKEGASEESMRDTLIGLLIAAYDATMSSTSTGLWIMAQHPEAWLRIRLEARSLPEGPTTDQIMKLPYTAAVTRELRRLFSPAHLNDRFFPKGLQVNGWSLPPKSRIFIAPGVTQRLPEYWDNPDSFCPDRFLNGREYPRGVESGFGFGPHSCLGQGLARLFQTLVLLEIARRDLTLAPVRGSSIKHQLQLMTIARQLPLQVLS